MQTTTERLQGYYPFSDSTLHSVEAAALRPQYRTLDSYFGRVGIGQIDFLDYGTDGQVEIVDIRRDQEKDVFIYHLPMANPLDTNQLFQIATVADVLPNTRIIAAGNPAGLGRKFKGGSLDKPQRDAVRQGVLSPVVAPLNHYVEDQGITEVGQIAYSWGVEKANEMTASVNAKVTDVIEIEPVSFVPRGVIKLFGTFMSTNKGLKELKANCDFPMYKEARKTAIKGLPYLAGILRPTNQAMAEYMARGELFFNADEALDIQRDARLHVAWGSKGEFGGNADSAIPRVVRALTVVHGVERVFGMRLRDGKHALANDVYLQAAIVHESLGRVA